MDGEIILDRKNTNVMKLDDSEQALMNEIEIDVPRRQPVKKQISQMKTQFTAPQPQVFQEDIDSFANPNKQTQQCITTLVFTNMKQQHRWAAKKL